MSADCYPYSDQHQCPPSRSPWQRGCDLYEAYGRFLDRMKTGEFHDDYADGWTTVKYDTYRSHTDFYVNSETGYSQDSGSYDASFGYTEEEQCERHKQKELAKLSRAGYVNSKASMAVKKFNEQRKRYEAWKADCISLLRKCGKMTTKQIEAAIGNPPTSKTTMVIRLLVKKGEIQGVPIPKSRNGQYLWSLKEKSQDDS